MAIGVAIAGMGVRGRQWASAVNADPRFRLEAIVDVDALALHDAALGAAVAPERRFNVLADALERTTLDAVIVATPPGEHFEGCETALARGRSVLVEKPFTTRLEHAVRLVALARRQGVPLLVGQQYRYLRVQRAVRRLVRDGELGRVGMVSAHFYHGSEHLPASGASEEHSVLWGPAVHHIDALRYVLGKRITGVVAQLFTTPWGALPDGASLQAMLTLEDGVRAMYSATYESSGHEYFERGQEFYERLVGERATLHVVHRWLVLCRPGKRPRWIRRGSRPVTEEAILLDRLQRALLHGDEGDASGEDNLDTMAAVEACARSAREGRWVDPRELLAAADPDYERPAGRR